MARTAFGSHSDNAAIAVSPQQSAYFPNCRAAHQAGRTNIRRGEPGYRPQLDADGDGFACEPLVISGRG